MATAPALGRPPPWRSHFSLPISPAVLGLLNQDHGASSGFIADRRHCGAERGFAGDGGPATEALFKVPFGVAVHRSVLDIADTGSHRIRAVRLE